MLRLILGVVQPDVRFAPGEAHSGENDAAPLSRVRRERSVGVSLIARSMKVSPESTEKMRPRSPSTMGMPKLTAAAMPPWKYASLRVTLESSMQVNAMTSISSWPSSLRNPLK